MDSDNLEAIKLLMIGPSGAGKSALLIRYCDDQFDSESSTATIGVDFKVKKLSVRGKSYRLNLLDTAGQERFRTLSNSYYRGAHGIILVYDISNRESFLAMERWYDEVVTNSAPGAVTYLVGTKLDKEAWRKVTTAEGAAFAEKQGSSFCEVSSKVKVNVRKPFTEIVDQIVSTPGLLGRISQRRTGVDLKGPTSANSYGGCSC